MGCWHNVKLIVINHLLVLRPTRNKSEHLFWTWSKTSPSPRMTLTPPTTTNPDVFDKPNAEGISRSVCSMSRRENGYWKWTVRLITDNWNKTRIFATGKHHAVVNLFRNTVNNVRKLSTSPVRRVTTASGKCKKLSTKIRKRQRGVTTLQRYSCWASLSLP